MTEHPMREKELLITRKHFFGRTSLGLSTAAMAALLGTDLCSSAAAAAPATKLSSGMHHVPRAKRVIYLFMSGGPSHHDLWDYKPKMRDMSGEDLPEHIRVPQDDTASSRAAAASTLKEFKETSERAFLVQKLRENGWNISHTAQVIGTPRSNLYKKLEQYQITQESDG